MAEAPSAGPVHDPIDWDARREGGASLQRPRAAGGQLPRRVAARRLRRGHRRGRSARRRAHRAARRRARHGRRSSTAPRGCRPTSRRCGACSRRSPRASASAWPRARSRRSAAGSPAPRSACCSATSRSACSASTTCSSSTTTPRRRRRLLRRAATSSRSRSASRSRHATSGCGSRIHEVTHRAQFTGVPWMKRLLPLAGRAARSSSIDPDPTPPRAGARRARPTSSATVATRSTTAASSRCSRATSSAARSAQVQALMSLLEGHGDAVMNQLGARARRRARRAWRGCSQARRQSTGMAAFLQKLIGLEAKMRQYEVGEAFVAAVERRPDPGRSTPRGAAPSTCPTARRARRARSTGSPGSTPTAVRPATAAAVDPLAPLARPTFAAATRRPRARRWWSRARAAPTPSRCSCSRSTPGSRRSRCTSTTGCGRQRRRGRARARARRRLGRRRSERRGVAVDAGPEPRSPRATRGTPRWRRRASSSAPTCVLVGAHRRRPGRDRAAQRAARRGARRARGHGAAARHARAPAARRSGAPTRARCAPRSGSTSSRTR